MKNLMQRGLTLGLIIAAGAFATSGSAETETNNLRAGRADTYKDLHDESLEHLSAPSDIESVAAGALQGQAAPTQLWRVLEHGEKVECLNCIPAVSKLLYHQNPKNREISAWWLRRRIFGVFGPGQVYSQTLDTLADDTAPESRRAYAAEALGEFLAPAGIPAVALAAIGDSSAMVRASAVNALRRLNNEGPNGELGAALSDDDVEVRMAAVDSVTRVHVFTGVDSLAERLGDESPRIRARAALALGTMRARDTVAGLSALLANDTDANVRKSAAAALGEIGDSTATTALEAALADSDSFVRQAARISLRRL